MTQSTSTPEEQKLPADPDKKTRQNPADETSLPERDGFFRRVRRELKPDPVHPSEAAEIVVDPETLE